MGWITVGVAQHSSTFVVRMLFVTGNNAFSTPGPLLISDWCVVAHTVLEYKRRQAA